MCRTHSHWHKHEIVTRIQWKMRNFWEMVSSCYRDASKSLKANNLV